MDHKKVEKDGNKKHLILPPRGHFLSHSLPFFYSLSLFLFISSLLLSFLFFHFYRFPFFPSPYFCCNLPRISLSLFLSMSFYFTSFFIIRMAHFITFLIFIFISGCIFPISLFSFRTVSELGKPEIRNKKEETKEERGREGKQSLPFRFGLEHLYFSKGSITFRSFLLFL